MTDKTQEIHSSLREFVPNVKFELIPIKDLISNQEYQRNLSIKHVKKTAENFDLYQLNPVKVSRRNGINYVLNGQHTVEVIATVSGSRETPVWCMVYDDLFYEAEADIFANQTKYTKSLSPYEIFNANVEAASDKHLIIKDLVEEYNMTIAAQSGPGCICAVSSLEFIYDRYGYHVLDRTLRLTIGTWEGDVASFSGNMLKGISHVVYTYGDSVKDDVFKERCSRESVKEVSRDARARKSGSIGYAEKLVMLYNKGSRGGLPISKLCTAVNKAARDAKARKEAEEKGIIDEHQSIQSQ